MKKLLIVLALTFIIAIPLISLGQEKPDFVPLTNLPGIDEVATSETLPSFFNNIYKLCIGAAAVIAVLQIMRAGSSFMLNKGSVAHNEQAKSLIMNSVLGLLLVLSPAIVFAIINPDILDLKLDFASLKPRDLKQLEVGGPPPGSDAESQAEMQEVLDRYNSGTVTGTVLQKGVYPTKAGLDEFVTSCTNTARIHPNPSITNPNGSASTKGCTKKCTAGTEGCNTEGCAEYTAFCTSPEKTVITESVTGQTYRPIRSYESWYNSFTSACNADGGKFLLTTNTSRTKDIESCDGNLTCYDATLRCNP